MLQLGIPRGLDARLSVSNRAHPNLTSTELEALLTLFEQAPIVPKTGVDLRPPVADELGLRDEDEQVTDRIAAAVMEFRRVAYSKPTLLLEIERALEVVRTRAATLGHGTGSSNRFTRAPLALRRGLDGAGVVPRQTILSSETAPTIHRGVWRGIFGTCGPVFRHQRKAVEEWVRSQRISLERAPVWPRMLGWALLVIALPLFWIFHDSVTVLMVPLVIWVGVLLIYRVRIRRYVKARTGALEARRSVRHVPEYVERFFGAHFPERSFALHVYAFGIGIFVYLFFILIFMLTSSFSTLSGYASSEQSWERPFAIPVIALIVVSIALIARWVTHMSGALARARAEWMLLCEATAP